MVDRKPVFVFTPMGCGTKAFGEADSGLVAFGFHTDPRATFENRKIAVTEMSPAALKMVGAGNPGSAFCSRRGWAVGSGSVLRIRLR
jgi:hypothetical protein